ncbi:EcsC family protein [Bacillus massilinigeriensis]|uniref:EcsC family protein n=1 Tax=Bacillus massilionigeriensis TaxID=1805475 RepID=UPI00096B43B6|nr:EcsC family protein [Bacillus massilionigeriensis]
MALTEREKSVLMNIKEWENRLFEYEANDFELMYEKYLEKSFSLLPEEIQTKFFTLLDQWLFYLHAIIQGSQLQVDARERILSAGRVFYADIESVDDLKKLNIDQLQYIAEQQIARHRFYSFAQGGISGTGGALLLGSDIPAIAIINLKVIQLIATTYGFEINKPYEMMTSLKVFHAATSPRRMKKSGWEQLIQEIDNQKEHYFYEGKEEITDISWMDQPLVHILKAFTILIFRKRSIKGVPFISMAIGAGTNYQLTRSVTDFAHKYYQLRYLLEKEQGLHEY